MSVSERIRRLSRLVPFPALLLAAACGGGDNKSPTGPGGEGGDAGHGSAIEFRLFSLGPAGRIPADLEVEDCTMTRFKSGKIAIDPNTGEWQMDLQVHDNTGDWGFRDWGQSQGDGSNVLFQSDYSGVTYPGGVNDDGTGEIILYDWCADGVPDVNLVFNR
jgi:hypothetical protein